MIRALFLLLLLAVPLPVVGLEPYLVKDINPEPEPGGSAPAGFAAIGNVAVFDAYDGVADRTLWRTDGTPAGTWPLADTCQPDCPDALERFASVGDRHLFLAHSEPSDSGKDLWVTDGTVEGTLRLTEDVAILARTAWVPEQGVLYFVADDGIHGRELWRTDGTPAGTRLAADVRPGPEGSDPSQLTAFRGRIWFAAGAGLWRSDGTRTALVKPVAPRLLRVVGKRLAFVAPGEELWATDGTARGTVVLTNLKASFLDAVVHGSLLYFTATTRRQGQELWVSDGTARGTRALTHFPRREAFHAPLESMFLSLPRSSPGRFVFAAHDGVHGPEPWVTDGTPRGTRLLRDLCPGRCGGLDAIWLAHRGLLYMTATDGERGSEPWVTDGTGKGTRLLRDVCEGSCDSLSNSFVVLENSVLFSAWNGGFELWSTDGTSTVRLSEFEPEHPWQTLHGAVLPGKLVFGAGDGVHGIELWVADAEGTRLVRDLNDVDIGGSFPSGLRELDGRALFFADDGLHGYELWKSDGTEAGTAPVAELVPGEEPSDPPLVLASAVAGDSLFLSLEQAGLWRTDGTAVRKVADVEAWEMVAFQEKVWLIVENELQVLDGEMSPVPGVPQGLSHLTVHGDRLWFTVGVKLWSSDGVTASPALDLGVPVHFLASLGKDLIVSAGEALLATDGKDIRAIGPAGLGRHMVFQERLWYSSLQLPSVLWVTDGTAGGTKPFQGIPAASAFAVLGERLLFTTALPNAPLWQSDGTEAGTFRVRDLAPGWRGDWELLQAGPRIFFLASDRATGVELWAVE